MSESLPSAENDVRLGRSFPGPHGDCETAHPHTHPASQPGPTPDDDDGPPCVDYDAALSRVREYLNALDGFYGDEEIPDVLDTSDGDSRSPALRLSDVRTLATRVLPPGSGDTERRPS